MEQARVRLLKKATKLGRVHRVTHADIQKEAGLQGTCSGRTAQDALRAVGVRFRTPRHKVHLTANDAG